MYIKMSTLIVPASSQPVPAHLEKSEGNTDDLSKSAKLLERAKSFLIGAINKCEHFPLHCDQRHICFIIDDFDFPFHELDEWLEENGYVIGIKWEKSSDGRYIESISIDMI